MEENQWKMANLLVDEYSVKILQALKKGPKSVKILNRETGVPIAACYRRVHDMEIYGLISVDHIETIIKNRQEKHYKANVTSTATGTDEVGRFYTELNGIRHTY